MKIVRNRNSGKSTWTVRSKDDSGGLIKLRKNSGDVSGSFSPENESPIAMRATRASLRNSSNTSFSASAMASPSPKEYKKTVSLKRKLSSPSNDKVGDSKLESSSAHVDSSFSEVKQKRRVGRPPKKKFPKLVHFDDSGTGKDCSNASLRVSLADLSQVSDAIINGKKSAISSGSETDTHSENIKRELRPRNNPNSSQSLPYSEARQCSRRDSSLSGIVRGSDQIARPTSRRRKFLENSTDIQQSDTAIEDEDETRENDEEEHSEGRRYPVRNRRNTAVYQVQCPQNHHPHHRRWMTADLGHETSRRIRRHNGRYSRHTRPDSASSSSSNDLNSDTSSDSLRNPVSTYRKHSSSYWMRPTSDADKQPSRLNGLDEQLFEQRRTKSIMHARSELMPINLNQLDHGKSAFNKRLLAGTSLADIEPMSLDTSIGFDQVAGHESHISALKESIILPLMYPEIFSQFGIAPPQGCLFTGPPGTGKTLLARALANECTRLNQSTTDGSVKRRPIAFFMRKGADCLSKWVGESERHLRLLFDQAYRMRPSIIFFDEIDGLAPVRSSKQDQIHSSIVSTLLSLMDGLDNRAEVVVIGATNRPDSLDPALRRPGRFDREFQFGLPIESVRKQILSVHTRKWNPKPDDELLSQLATATNNFSGADLKALTTEACLCCLRRCYPQVYNSQVKLALDFRYLVVNRSDWFKALQVVRASTERYDADLSAANLTPSANALWATSRTPLVHSMTILLQSKVDLLATHFLNALIGPIQTNEFSQPSPNYSNSSRFLDEPDFRVPKSRILLSGNVSDCLMNAVWHKLESTQIYTLNLANLLAFPTSIGICPEAAVAQIVSAIRCAVKKSPPLSVHNQSKHPDPGGVIVYLPRIDILFKRLSPMTASYLVERLDSLVNEINSDWMMRINLLPPNGLPYASLGYSTLSSHYSSRLLLVATITRPEKTSIYSNSLNSLSRIVRGQKKDKLSPVELKSPGVRGNSISALNKEKDAKLHIPNGFHTSSTVGNHIYLQTSKEKPNNSLPPKHRLKLTIARSLASHQNHLETDTDDYHHDDSMISDAESHLSSQESSNTENEHEVEDREPSIIFNNCSEISTDRTYARKSLKIRSRIDRLLSSLFDKEQVDLVNVDPPDSRARSELFGRVILEWCKVFSGNRKNTATMSNEQDEKDRPPTPQPVPNTPDPVESYYKRLSKEELAELDRQESQLFRRLRQVLRRVVAHLLRHRRFVVFSRPVQIDEAPDYYEVIKEPIDLGLVRDKIDSHQYTNVEDFMRDIELIHLNALEYNPANVPRSRDIRSRAFEFWDEACLCLEEELDPPDLNDQCKAATLARSIRMTKPNGLDHEPNKLTRSTAISTMTNSKRKSDHPTSNMSPNRFSSQPKPPPPLPQGDRYSRRLHGEPPILGTEDVQQLEAISRRRSHGHHSETSNPDYQSPVSNTKGSIDLDSSVPKSPTNNIKSPKTKSPTEHNSEPLTSSPISSPVKNDTTFPETVRTPSPASKTQCSSPTLEPSRQTPIQDLSPGLKSACQLKLNLPKLQELHQSVVSQTDGWSTDQLINLYSDFVSVVLWRYGRLTDRSNLHLDLEHVFKLHSDIASTRPSLV